MSKYTMAMAGERIKQFVMTNVPTRYMRGGLERLAGEFRWFPSNDQEYPVSGRVYIEWEVCWAVGCSMAFASNGEVSITWSSTGRSVTQATACVALYREVVEFGAALEAFMKEELEQVARGK